MKLIQIDNRLKIYPEITDSIFSHLRFLGLLCDNNTEPEPETRYFQKYTLYHKQAFLACSMELYDKRYVEYRHALHDTDKLVLYGMMHYKEASRLHKLTSRHHILNCKTQEDLEECVIDYECCRFTKGDKPENAYDWIKKRRPEYYGQMKPILLRFGLNSPSYRSFTFKNWNNLTKADIDFIVKLNLYGIDQTLRLLTEFDGPIEETLKEYNHYWL